MINLETTYFNDVTKIPDTIFESLGCDDSFYFEKAFLFAFAKANPSIEHRYLVITEATIPIALAIMQQLSVAIDNAPEKLSLQNRIARSLQCYLNNRSVSVTVCGNVFLSGNYSIFVKKGVETSSVYEHIAQEMKPLRTKKRASVFFLKDFTQQELKDTKSVETHQFHPFAVEPNMRLPLQWKTFEDYKAVLRSKYRVKVNKADSQSASLTVKSFNAQDIEEHLETLQQLYSNITDRALFTTIDMHMETYALLKENFKERMFLHTYWNQNKMVGFAASFKVDGILNAHYIGIDYSCNKELSIYPRILNDYVRLGLELGVKEVNFGRTSSEIKSTLGALPEDLTCYVRHRRTLANFIFKPLIRQIKMTEYKQHRPFKKT